MFGARPPPPTIAEVKQRAARQGNVYFIRTPDSQGRSTYFFEVSENRFLQLQRGKWLLQSVQLERCYQDVYKNAQHFLKQSKNWARLSAPGFPQTDYLIAGPEHRVETQVRPPSAASFKVKTRGSPTTGNQGGSSDSSSQKSADHQTSNNSSPAETTGNSSHSNTQPLTDQEDHLEEAFVDSNPLGQEQLEVEEVATAESQQHPEENQEDPALLSPRRQGRVDSLVWDPLGEQLHEQAESPPIPSAQPRRESNENDIGSRESSTEQNLMEMATGGGASRTTLQERLRAEFAATDLLGDENIRNIGKLLAKIDDLDAAIGRSRDYGDIGYPTVLPSCRTIQSPSPTLLNDDLVKKMNLILHQCGEKLTTVLMEAQIEERNRLRIEVDEALSALKPTPEQEAAIELQRKRRRRTEGSIKDLPENEEALPFLRAPDTTKGERLIVPNRDIGRIFSTGERKPRGRENNPGGSRNRSKSGNRGRGGSRSHSRGRQGQRPDDAGNQNQSGFQGRGRGRGGWRHPSNSNRGGNNDGQYSNGGNNGGRRY